MNMKDVFKIIDLKSEELKKFWIELVNIESYSSDKEDVDKLGNLISEYALRKGLETKKYHFERSGNGLVISISKDRKLPPVALMAHMDTVQKKGKFGYPLIHEDNEFLYGPGVYDCKGGIAVAMLVMTTLKDIGYSERQVKLILSPDEEVSNTFSGQDGISFIRNNVRGSVMAFNCESGSKSGDIVVGRKGVTRLQIDIKGRAAHSGSAYDNGISAIKEAAHKIIQIEKPSNSENMTFNCGVINGGTGPNTIPENCSFIVDIRYNTLEDKELAIEHIKNIVNTSYIKGTVAEYKMLNDRIPMIKTEDNIKLFNHLKVVSEKYRLEELNYCYGGGGSDSSYSVAEGVPSLCAVGIAGSHQHTLNERAEIDSLARRAKMLTAAILEYSEI